MTLSAASFGPPIFRGSEGSGRGGRAGEPGDLMARADELGDNGGADPAGRAGDKNAHTKPPDMWTILATGQAREPAMSVADISIVLMSAAVIN